MSCQELNETPAMSKFSTALEKDQFEAQRTVEMRNSKERKTDSKEQIK